MLVNEHIPTSTVNAEDQNHQGWKTDGFKATYENGAAGVCSGVTHGDSAISGEAPGWMHIDRVDHLYGIEEKEFEGVWGPPPETWEPVLAVDNHGTQQCG